MKKLEISSSLGLEITGEKWMSTSNDPQLYVQGTFKKGWHKIEILGSSESLRVCKAYIDYGKGFNEEDAQVFGKLDKKQDSFIPIEFKKDVKALRLDPGDAPGLLTVKCISISKIGTFSIIKSALSNYKLMNQGQNILHLTVKILGKLKENGLKWAWGRAVTLMTNKQEYSSASFQPYHYNEEERVSSTTYAIEPLFSIIIPIKKANYNYLESSIVSLANQSYSKIELILISTDELDLNKIKYKADSISIKTILSRTESFFPMLEKAFQETKGNYITFMEQEDFLSVNAFHYIVNTLRSNEDLLFANEDRFFSNGEHFAPFYKEQLEQSLLEPQLLGNFFVIKRNLLQKINIGTLDSYIQLQQCLLEKAENPVHVSKIIYHKRVSEPAWTEVFQQNMQIVSFYLPQFHAIPENDEWWGEGFTEWTNVRRGTPLFEEHYQPHVPADLGYYNLLEERDIQAKQISLAKDYNIHGFCYYYYWFDGKRLLEKPLNNFLQDPSLDLPFCICWANESWSRRWDGQEKELLMQQVHNEDSDQRFIKEAIPVLKDKRYIRINGEDPILLIYRAELFPNLKATVMHWKEECRVAGIENLHVCMVQSFGQVDPTIYGCDSAVEFPPHGVYANEISKSLPGLADDFSGNIYDYREVVERSLQKKNSNKYPWFRGAMLSWDNTARRKNAANIFYGATPLEYEKWLIGLVDHTRRFNKENEQLIFVNAWNEWAEGTHLEPDQKFGHQYLEATQRAKNVR